MQNTPPNNKNPRLRIQSLTAEPSKDDDASEKADDKKQRDEIGGVKGPEPTRYGDWTVGGRCTDF